MGRTVAEQSRIKRARLKAAGLCLRCPNKTKGGRVHCSSCEAAQRQAHITRYHANRRSVIEHYGGKCRWCGIDKYEFLTLDHKNNDGALQRKTIKTAALPLWIITNDFPDSFEVLCWNCNYLKSKKAMLEKCQSKKAIASRNYRMKLRFEVLSAYGSECCCCQVNNFDLLTIDHVGGGGRKHRLSMNNAPTPILYALIRRENFPDTYRVMCFNCNSATHFYGTCPHHRASRGNLSKGTT